MGLSVLVIKVTFTGDYSYFLYKMKFPQILDTSKEVK